MSVDNDFAKWSLNTRELINSGDKDAKTAFSSYRYCVDHGEFDHLELFVDPQKASVDVGANYGSYGLKLSNMCRKVLCIEPVRELAFLGSFLPSNCIFENVAVGRERGVATLRIPSSNETVFFSRSTLAVSNSLRDFICKEQETVVKPLDELVNERLAGEQIGFIKIDVEGLEYEALEGAVETFKKHRPNLKIELHSSAGIEKVFDFMKNLGFRGVFFYEKRIFDASQFNREIHRNPENESSNMRKRGIEFDNAKFVADFYFIPAK